MLFLPTSTQPLKSVRPVFWYDCHIQRNNQLSLSFPVSAVVRDEAARPYLLILITMVQLELYHRTVCLHNSETSDAHISNGPSSVPNPIRYTRSKYYP